MKAPLGAATIALKASPLTEHRALPSCALIVVAHLLGFRRLRAPQAAWRVLTEKHE